MKLTEVASEEKPSYILGHGRPPIMFDEQGICSIESVMSYIIVC